MKGGSARFSCYIELDGFRASDVLTYVVVQDSHHDQSLLSTRPICKSHSYQLLQNSSRQRVNTLGLSAGRYLEKTFVVENSLRHASPRSQLHLWRRAPKDLISRLLQQDLGSDAPNGFLGQLSCT